LNCCPMLGLRLTHVVVRGKSEIARLGRHKRLMTNAECPSA
jgi:hypothetical protein